MWSNSIFSMPAGDPSNNSKYNIIIDIFIASEVVMDLVLGWFLYLFDLYLLFNIPLCAN